jgi:uroporphyrinogen III methyltransferase/synthase
MNDDSKLPSTDKVGKRVDKDVDEEVLPVEVDLTGRKIVVTRPPHQAIEFESLLVENGAQAVLYPCIDIVLPEELAQLDAALEDAADGQFDWLIFTSANTVRIIAQRLESLNMTLADVRNAVIGPKTAEVVEKLLGLSVDMVAQNYTAEGLARALQPVAGLSFLLPQSEIARPVLAQALRDHGAEVMTIVAYRTVLGQGGADVPGLLAGEEIDAITFSSSSTARNFLTRLENEGGSRRHLDGVCLAAIGPITAATMASLDLPVTLTPEEFTLPSLVSALDAYFRSQTKESE